MGAVALLHMSLVAQTTIGGVTIGTVVVGSVVVGSTNTAYLHSVLSTPTTGNLLPTLLDSAIGSCVVGPTLNRCEM